MRPLQTEAEQYHHVARKVHGAPPERRWHVLRCCVDRVGTCYTHAVLTQVYLEVVAYEHELPAPPVPLAWRTESRPAEGPADDDDRSRRRRGVPLRSSPLAGDSRCRSRTGVPADVWAPTPGRGGGDAAGGRAACLMTTMPCAHRSATG
jgi:hypothetical protein